MFVGTSSLFKRHLLLTAPIRQVVQLDHPTLQNYQQTIRVSRNSALQSDQRNWVHFHHAFRTRLSSNVSGSFWHQARNSSQTLDLGNLLPRGCENKTNYFGVDLEFYRVNLPRYMSCGFQVYIYIYRGIYIYTNISLFCKDPLENLNLRTNL